MKKEIVLINNGLAGGGTERASVNFAHYLLEKGFKVTILALYKSEPFFVLNSGINFIEPEFSREKSTNITYTIKMVNFVRKNVKEIKPVSILSYNEWTNAYVLLALLGLNHPVYVSERMHPKAVLPFTTALLRKLLYPRAAGIIAQTNYGKNIIQGITGSKNVFVIPNAVNVMNSHYLNKKKQIIAVGRLELVKGHRYLIEAFAKVVDKSWKLCIIGDGSQKETLIELTTELGIDERVTFLGHQKDFRKELSESQIYVLPSLKEGFPNSLIEAMSVPLACISGDFYEGSEEIIRDEVNGLLVQPGNDQELSEQLNKLIEDKGLRSIITEKSKEVRERYSMQIVGEKLLKILMSK